MKPEDVLREQSAYARVHLPDAPRISVYRSETIDTAHHPHRVYLQGRLHGWFSNLETAIQTAHHTRHYTGQLKGNDTPIPRKVPLDVMILGPEEMSAAQIDRYWSEKLS